MDIDELHLQVAAARQFGEEPVLDLNLTVENNVRLLAQAEAKSSEWRLVKQALTQTLADNLAGRRVRYGQTYYRSRRKRTRSIPPELRTEFAEWVHEGGPHRIAQLFNPNQVRYGQLRDMEAVDRDTGEIGSAFYKYVHEETDEDAPWMLEALPSSRWPAYAETMPEGEVR
jgi:hypothetical protein